MDENNVIIDVNEYYPVEDLTYYNAVQVAEIIGEPVSTVRTWTRDDCFGDLLNIKKVNGRRVYVKRDIDNLKFIKELRQRNYGIKQTRDYISKKGFEFGDFDGGLIDQKDPLGFEALAIMISQKQDEKLQTFKKDIINELNTFLKTLTQEQSSYMQNMVDEIAISVDDRLDKIRNDIGKDLESVKDEYIDNKESLDNIREVLSKQEKMLEEIRQSAYVSTEEIKKISYKDPKEGKLSKVWNWLNR